MKRNLSLWLGLLAFALLPALAQTPTPTGKIHGRVIGPEGNPRSAGTISLSNDSGHSFKFNFPVSANGNYAGEATPGTYILIFRAPNSPPDQMVDSIENVKIVAGQDLLQDDDMTRKEFYDKLTSQEKKDVEELRKKNAEVMKNNAVISNINADIKLALQDFADANASKDAGVKTAKFSESESLMLKDTAVKPDAAVLWLNLAKAQSGLKKYDDAVTSYKKVLDLVAKKPDPTLEGAADAGLGEVYANTGKVPEANAAYDAAAKANPAGAAGYFKTEAGIFTNLGNADAQVAAAQEAVKADPNMAFAYYLIGNGLVGKSVADPKTNMLVPPPGCLEAYQMYLKLDPAGQYAADVKSIMASLQTALPPTVSTKSGKRK
jgi:tetratricopeptide (TPR) repeat protein